MPNFREYLMRYGEHGVQDLIERLERSWGIKPNAPLSLEERWDAVMQRSEEIDRIYSDAA